MDSSRVEELDRRKRVIDMMLSGHSILRERYKRWSEFLDLFILLLSVVLLMTALVDPAVMAAARIEEDDARLAIALASAFVFFLSLFQLRIDWRQKAAEHGLAARTLADLKAKCTHLRTSAQALSDQDADSAFREM